MILAAARPSVAQSTEFRQLARAKFAHRNR